ncbi:MAG TPA: DUF1707 and DUF4870 domain-containing protein [Propionibacteriaceae bacterium]|nr:DUF1707 and DUF4870 domain-containing protein [Propionibacteriaceae bacterium]
MSTLYQPPSLQMYVTPEQRDRAERWLQEAYADGRISEDEFDRRIGQVISSTTRQELNGAFYGLVQVPMPSQVMGVHPAYQPMVRPETGQHVGRGAAGFAHLSVFFVWILGPALVFALSPVGSYARREAAKAFNFQVVSAISLVVVAMAAAITNIDAIGLMFPLMALYWLVSTVVGGSKALQGEDWTNPARRVLKLEVLPEK